MEKNFVQMKADYGTDSILGVGFLTRKMANGITSMQVEITKNGEEFSIKNISKIKTSEVKFKLNQEAKETTMDGREVNVSWVFELLIAFTAMVLK